MRVYLKLYNSLSHLAAFLERLKFDEDKCLKNAIEDVETGTYRLLCELSIEISNMGAAITDHVTRDEVESDFSVVESHVVPRYSRIYVVAKRSHDLFSALINYYSTSHNHLTRQKM